MAELVHAPQDGKTRRVKGQAVSAVEERHKARLSQERIGGGLSKGWIVTAPIIGENQALQPLLAGIDSTFEQLQELDGSHAGQLTLVSGARMVLEELGSPLRRCREQFPQIELRLLHGDNRAAEGLITGGEADLALTLEPGPGALAKSVATQRAYPIDYLAGLSANHPLAKKSPLRLRDLVPNLSTSVRCGCVLPIRRRYATKPARGIRAVG